MLLMRKWVQKYMTKIASKETILTMIKVTYKISEIQTIASLLKCQT